MKTTYGAYIKKIKLDVFHCNVHIVITENPNYYMDRSCLRKICGDNKEFDYTKACSGMLVYDKPFNYYIILPPIAKIDVAIHETCHCINRIFEHRNYKADYANDEIYCYYLGWLSEKTLTHLQNVYYYLKDKATPEAVRG